MPWPDPGRPFQNEWLAGSARSLRAPSPCTVPVPVAPAGALTTQDASRCYKQVRIQMPRPSNSPDHKAFPFYREGSRSVSFLPVRGATGGFRCSRWQFRCPSPSPSAFMAAEVRGTADPRRWCSVRFPGGVRGWRRRRYGGFCPSGSSSTSPGAFPRRRRFRIRWPPVQELGEGARRRCGPSDRAMATGRTIGLLSLCVEFVEEMQLGLMACGRRVGGVREEDLLFPAVSHQVDMESAPSKACVRLELLCS